MDTKAKLPKGSNQSNSLAKTSEDNIQRAIERTIGCLRKEITKPEFFPFGVTKIELELATPASTIRILVEGPVS